MAGKLPNFPSHAISPVALATWSRHVFYQLDAFRISGFLSFDARGLPRLDDDGKKLHAP